MSEQLIWAVGNRNPSITENLVYADGTVVDLTGSTVKFKMRAPNSATLKVDASAVIVGSPTLGNVRYDWAALDVDTNGFFLCWWEVTTSGKTQDMLEAVIEFRAHAPETNAYVELEEIKSTGELTGTGFADADLQPALVAASRGIDLATGRRFYPDADATQIRYYTPDSATWVKIDDLITFTSLATDRLGGTSFADSWTLNSDFVLEPLNAVADGWPYQSLRVQPQSSLGFPRGYARSVRVTGKFGWAAPPDAVKTLTKMIAARLVKRTRESPLGFVEMGFEGAVVRASAYARDPDYQFLIGPYMRNSGVY